MKKQPYLAIQEETHKKKQLTLTQLPHRFPIHSTRHWPHLIHPQRHNNGFTFQKGTHKLHWSFLQQHGVKVYYLELSSIPNPPWHQSRSAPPDGMSGFGLPGGQPFPLGNIWNHQSNHGKISTLFPPPQEMNMVFFLGFLQKKSPTKFPLIWNDGGFLGQKINPTKYWCPSIRNPLSSATWQQGSK